MKNLFENETLEQCKQMKARYETLIENNNTPWMIDTWISGLMKVNDEIKRKELLTQTNHEH